MIKLLRPSSRIALVALALAAALPGRLAVAQGCQGDILANGIVDGADLGGLLSYWGPRTADPFSVASDIDGNGTVDGADLGVLLASWGYCPVATVPTWATLVEAAPDPAVVTNPELRAAISATGLAWRVRDMATQMEMMLIPPGTFQMGCILGSSLYDCYSWELPVHQVTLTTAFYLARYEVTQAQWQATMGSNPSLFQSPSSLVPAAEVPNRPVEQVSWYTLQGFLANTGMRLPTEAEWEFACRAGTQTPFYNGSTDDSSVGSLAWYGGCCTGNAASQTHPVGGKAANGFGLYDMLGNVWECVSDWYGTYPSDVQMDPTGPAIGTERVARGGTWSNNSSNVRSSSRYSVDPSLPLKWVGFRVARDP